MKTSRQQSPPLLALACVLLGGGLAWAAAGSNPHAWQRWEHALTSTRSYNNPYADVTLRVAYTGPAGRTVRAGLVMVTASVRSSRSRQILGR